MWNQKKRKKCNLISFSGVFLGGSCCLFTGPNSSMAVWEISHNYYVKFDGKVTPFTSKEPSWRSSSDGVLQETRILEQSVQLCVKLSHLNVKDPKAGEPDRLNTDRQALRSTRDVHVIFKTLLLNLTGNAEHGSFRKHLGARVMTTAAV